METRKILLMVLFIVAGCQIIDIKETRDYSTAIINYYTVKI